MAPRDILFHNMHSFWNEPLSWQIETGIPQGLRCVLGLVEGLNRESSLEDIVVVIGDVSVGGRLWK